LINHAIAAAVCLQLLDGRVSLHEVEVLQPAVAASHPYLSPQQHPDLLAEAVRASSSTADADTEEQQQQRHLQWAIARRCISNLRLLPRTTGYGALL
jgi:hypothetical protein